MKKDDSTLPLASVVELQTAVRPQTVDVGMMLQKVLEGGVTGESVEIAGKLMDLWERSEDRKAEQLFNEAFMALQKAMPRIEAVKAVPDKHGNTKYKYAPYEEIMEKTQPYLTAHGFSVSYDVNYQEGGRVAVTCKLKHVGGHTERNTFACRIGAGPVHATEPQADGAAKTIAKRNAYCDALNIVVEHDDDARSLGEPISAEKAHQLMTRVRNLELNEMAFLRYAGATDFTAIMSARLDDLENWLDKAAAKRTQRE